MAAFLHRHPNKGGRHNSLKSAFRPCADQTLKHLIALEDAGAFAFPTARTASVEKRGNEIMCGRAERGTSSRCAAAFASMYIISPGICLPACVWARHPAAVPRMKKAEACKQEHSSQKFISVRSRRSGGGGFCLHVKRNDVVISVTDDCCADFSRGSSR